MKRIAEGLPLGSYLASVNEPETITVAQAFYGHSRETAHGRDSFGGGPVIGFNGPVERS
jgi:hypothetical protein